LTYTVFGFIALIVLGCLGVVAMFITQYRRRKKESALVSESSDAPTDEDNLSDNEDTHE
jgi:heme/copper-type cytochrome/quinol oxidase subunit 2